MFTVQSRLRLESELLDRARADERISGAARFGSGALGVEDRWSDLDLAFGVREDADMEDVLADWTEFIRDRHGAVDTYDVRAGRSVYRVFLLADTLQVDLAFSPAPEFGARGPKFQLLHGEAVELPSGALPGPHAFIGYAWLLALHARSCIERGKAWQAEYMISGIRDQVISLACLLHGLPPEQGRGVDKLPADTRSRLEAALVRTLDEAELRRAFEEATALLLDEVAAVDSGLAARLSPPLSVIAGLH